MTLIPDPIDPLKGAIDNEGRLLGAVFMAPLGTPFSEIAKPENLVGYGLESS